MSDIKPCWMCGCEPTQLEMTYLNQRWVRLECMCCAGSYSRHVEPMIDSWNAVQDALLLQEALRQLNISPTQFIDAGERLRELVVKVSE